MKIDTERINKLLAEKKLSVSEAADLAGVSMSTLCNIKNGRTTCSYKTIGKIADGLGVALDDIVIEW